ncbi:MMPL family transporter [Paucidesulfovibrio longus]|uniref:MMPL family transporter n=1 Tax=Paucidesulfovibrio longus TaxID=889 RepID=UPI0003B5289E|nr:MMPL family transporter [Paucidesulfovibrio longus]
MRGTWTFPAFRDGCRKHLFALLVCTALVLVVSVYATATAPLRNDAQVLIPDRGGLAVDFALLQKASLAGKILINLHADSRDRTDFLAPAADRLAETLPGPLISKVISAPNAGLARELPEWLAAHAPILFDQTDLPRLADLTTPEAVRKAIQTDYQTLLSPQGAAFKELVRLDPLGLRSLLLPRLRGLQSLAKAKVDSGRFLSEDGRNLLVIAETPVPLTDAEGAAQLDAELRAAFQRLPEGVSGTYAAGQRHTLANAETIRSDVSLALGVSLLLLAGIFLLFLRSLRSIAVFLVPCGALVFALACVRATFGSISGVVAGFGAVLVGISIDYALHVHFACGTSGEDRGVALAGLARPLLFSALTSLGAFAALLASSIPAIRQLAVFSISGLAFSLFVSLMLLPQLPLGAHARPAPSLSSPTREDTSRRGSFRLLAPYGAFLLVCLFFARGARVDGDLHSLGYMDPDIVAQEQAIHETWGGGNSGTLLFTPPAPLEEALLSNDEAYALLRNAAPGLDCASLAALIPARETQRVRLGGWKTHWESGPGKQLRDALQAEASHLGFAPTAFAPFEAVLNGDVATATPKGAREAGLGDLLNLFLMPEGKAYRVLTFLPGGLPSPETLGPALARRSMRAVSAAGVKSELEQDVRNDTIRFLGISALTVLLLLVLLFRNFRDVAAAAAPPLCAGLAVAGFSGMAGGGLNLFSITAFPIVLGLCTDYGIFMVHVSQGRADASAWKATFVSGLTTLAGFGTLILARHPALHAMGSSVLFGVGAALPSALYVTPLLARRTP